MLLLVFQTVVDHYLGVCSFDRKMFDIERCQSFKTKFAKKVGKFFAKVPAMMISI